MPRSPLTRVALIFGGVSPEHEVSVNSGATAANGLAQIARLRNLAVQAIFINKEGEWIFGRPASGDLPTADDILAAPQWEMNPEDSGALILPFPAALARLKADGVNIVLNMLHGQNGEDGKLQGAFDLAEIAYTGAGAAASALAFDKPHCQAVLNAAGLPIAPSVALNRERMAAATQLLESPGLPLVVKPACAGSSVGITIVREADALMPAIEEALAIDDRVMVEGFVKGREFTCGVIESGGVAQALPITEIIPPEGKFFDYDAKYTAGVSREITPAEIPAPLTRRIQDLAVRTHLAVGCRGYSRVDFIADPAEPVILEINTLPGFTATSLLPQAAAAVGIQLPALIGMILDTAAYG